MSDPALIYALWIGIFVLITVVFVLTLTMLFRYDLESREKQRRKFINTWEPLLREGISKSAKPITIPKNADESVLLQLFSYYHEMLRGESKERLNRLGTKIGSRDYAKKLLRSGSIDKQLLALLSLGHMQDQSSWKLC
jgi:hypothetical protein